MFIKYDQDEITGFGTLLRPFSTTLWALIGLWFIGSTVAVIFVEYFTAKHAGKNGLEFTIADSAFASFITFVNQGKSLNFTQRVPLDIFVFS